MRWQDFNLPAGSNRQCDGSADSLIAYDGSNIGINNLYTPMCGNHSFDITSSGNVITLFVNPASDELDAMDYYRGFKAAYKSSK